MSKLKTLRQHVIKYVAKLFGVLALCVGAYIAAGSFADSSQEAKTKAEAEVNQLRAQLANMTSQIDKSGKAEKRFFEIASARKNNDYVANSDTLKEWLREAKDSFRFASDFKLTLAPLANVDKPEFAGLNYDVTLRDPMRIELHAMSDMHVFSFMQELLHASPGMVRITKWSIKREKDLDAAALTSMSSGQIIDMVEATIEFQWIGVDVKKANPAAAGVAPPGGPPPVPPIPGGPPGMAP